MKQLILAAVSLMLVAFSCSKDLPREPFELIVPVTQCNETALDNQLIKICLDSVKNDSRCPTDVQCVSSGTAAASFTITVAGQTTTQTLALKDYTYPGNFSQLNYNGYRFEFVLLEPQRRLSQPSAYSEYRATIRVTPL